MFAASAAMSKTRRFLAENTGFPPLFSDHDIRGLDDCDRVIAAFELEVIDGFVGDGRSNDNATADINPYMGRRLPLLDADYFSLELIAGTKFHRCVSNAGCLDATPPCQIVNAGLQRL
jgi:hypothetical protein